MDSTRTLGAAMLAIVVGPLGGCSTTGTQTAAPDHLARRIGDAHGMRDWQSVEVVTVDLVVWFGPNKMLEGTMRYAPHENLVRIERTDGVLLVFDGEHAWVSPASDESPMARFHLLTWPYFLAMPFKLRDPGSRRTGLPPTSFQGRRHHRLRLTFEAGVGDTPQDWYVLYANAKTYRLGAMGYIVTYGSEREQAESEPHAIVYGDEVWVGGLELATRWSFHHWSEADGPHGDPIGRAELSNLRLEPFDAAWFAKPPDAREDMLPGAAAPEPDPE